VTDALLRRLECGVDQAAFAASSTPITTCASALMA
jgi:hypothetical protein